MGLLKKNNKNLIMNRIKKIFFIFLIFLLISCKDNIKFDSKKWKEWIETETTQSLRWEMSKDLIKEHKLIGLKTSEIINLLGKPKNKNNSELDYYLGVSGNGINTGRLIIYIENDIVVDFKVFEG